MKITIYLTLFVIVMPLIAFCDEIDPGCFEDVCEGTGGEDLLRYYYDRENGICRQFLYGGWEGNGNNFETKEECIDTCRALTTCQEPPETGPCRAYFRRYFFNSDTLRCEKFTYGGCKGNDNNFKTIAECENACFNGRCQMPMDGGRCYAKMLKYYHDKDSGTCREFDYGGCKGNANRFENINDCEETCGVLPMCEQPPYTGPCLALFERYFFNKETGCCQNFTYGGCLGNDNNFETIEDCEKACKALPTCQQPPDAGPCDGIFERYFFNSDTLQCETFIYGGCGGNENNFETIEECEIACYDDLPTCQQPKKVGPCMAAFPRYYYNSEARQCQSFTYGGCQGNNNNFLTIEECERTCTPCNLEKCVGEGKANLVRYYYNKRHGRCECFRYGGRSGNRNNFKTMKDCENTCRVYCPPRNNIFCFREQNFCCHNNDCGCYKICCRENCGNSCYEPARSETNGTRVYRRDPNCNMDDCPVP